MISQLQVRFVPTALSPTVMVSTVVVSTTVCLTVVIRPMAQQKAQKVSDCRVYCSIFFAKCEGDQHRAGSHKSPNSSLTPISSIMISQAPSKVYGLLESECHRGFRCAYMMFSPTGSWKHMWQLRSSCCCSSWYSGSVLKDSVALLNSSHSGPCLRPKNALSPVL